MDAGRGGVGQSPLGGSARPGSQEELAATVGDRVLFATDAFRVGADQLPILQGQAEWMNRHRQVQVTVEGHADERGTREYNLALGQRRANAVRDILVSNGVAGARVQTISFGKDRPVQLGSSEESWAQNRRAVTVVR
jgi:peptidoglycan-associated lipoprotein